MLWGILPSPRRIGYTKLFSLSPLPAGKHRGHQEGVVEHKGIGLTVVQSIRRGYWVWTVHSDPPRSGEAVGKDWAIRQARKSIDVGLQKQKVLATLRANES